MLNVLHEICTWLRPGHLSVHVENGWRRSEEIVKISNCTFECDDDDDDDDDHDDDDYYNSKNEQHTIRR